MMSKQKRTSIYAMLLAMRCFLLGWTTSQQIRSGWFMVMDRVQLRLLFNRYFFTKFLSDQTVHLSLIILYKIYPFPYLYCSPFVSL